MAEYDLTLRVLTDRHPEQWAAWLLGQPPDRCQLRETSLPTLERRADLLLEVSLANRVFLQHAEFQTEYDPGMARRMLFYHVGFFLQYNLPVHSTVVWLTDEGYRPSEPLQTTVGDEEQLSFRYHEIRLWQLDAREHLERIEQQGLWSLLPLVALMGPGRQPELVEAAARRAARLPHQEERSDVSAGLAVLAGLRYNAGWIYHLIREERLMESSVLVDFMERGARRQAREDVLQALGVRFGATPADLEQMLRQVEALDTLNQLVREAIRCESLDAFRQALARLAAQE